MKATAKKLNEKQIQHQIVDYLEAKGWVVFETSQRGHSWATPGLPDLIAIRGTKVLNVVDVQIGTDDHVLWIECKGPRGKMSPAQVKAQQDIESQGGEYLLANSLDIVMEYLK